MTGTQHERIVLRIWESSYGGDGQRVASRPKQNLPLPVCINPHRSGAVYYMHNAYPESSQSVNAPTFLRSLEWQSTK